MRKRNAISTTSNRPGMVLFLNTRISAYYCTGYQEVSHMNWCGTGQVLDFLNSVNGSCKGACCASLSGPNTGRTSSSTSNFCAALNALPTNILSSPIDY